MSNAAQKAVTMQLFATINLRKGNRTQHDLAIELGLGAGSQEDKGMGTYFSRYLVGRSAMQPEDLQQIAQVALKKGLLRNSDVPAQLSSAIESLVGWPNTLLNQSFAQINRERAALTAARAKVIEALAELRVAMSTCRFAEISHTVGGSDDDSNPGVVWEGIGLDLEAAQRTIEASYVCIPIAKPLVDILPSIDRPVRRSRAGTNPAQSAGRTVSSVVHRSPKKSKGNQ